MDKWGEEVAQKTVISVPTIQSEMIQFHGNLVRDISVRDVSFPDSSVQKFTVGVGQNFQKKKENCPLSNQIPFP